MTNKKLLGNALLLITAMIWGTAFVAQRSGMEKIEPMTFTAARMALAFIAVGGVSFIARKRQRQTVDRRSTLAGGVCCGVFLALGSLLQQMGIVYTTAGKAGFITALYMLLVPVIGFLFFRRKISLRVWCAVAIGLVGMYLLCVREQLRLTRGDALVALCAIFFSLHILCCDHFAPRADPIALAAVQFGTVAALSAIAAFAMEEPSWEKIASAAIPILYCGLLSGGLGYTLQIVAQRFTEPTTAALLMSLESVFAVIAGALLLRERMTPGEAAGCAIMFLAILLVQLPSKKTESF